MAKSKTVYVCTECGNETLKWQGRCPACGAWNTITEFTPQPASPARNRGTTSLTNRAPVALSQVTSTREIRATTGMGAGPGPGRRRRGGVAGAVQRRAGHRQANPAAANLQRALPAASGSLTRSAEESQQQLKLRADRLQVHTDRLLVLSETSIDQIVACTEEYKPDLLIVDDSIQTLYAESNTATSGSASQVKDCTMRLLQLCKTTGLTVFIVGHVNKEGAIAGPKVLEHMVDCVLYFEGDPDTHYRLLRAEKEPLWLFYQRDRRFRNGRYGSERNSEPVGGPVGRPPGGRTGDLRRLCHGGNTADSRRGPGPRHENQLQCSPADDGNGFDFNRAALLMAVLEAGRAEAGDV